MNLITRTEFESLINTKPVKIVTGNLEIIELNHEQALRWFDDSSGWENHGYVAEAAHSVFIGFKQVNPDFFAIAWHQVGTPKTVANTN